jgi:HK97 family phage portal protein
MSSRTTFNLVPIPVVREKEALPASSFSDVPIKVKPKGFLRGRTTNYGHGTKAMQVSKYARLSYRKLSTLDYYELYLNTPDVRACIDSITRRVATWDWDILPAVDPRSDSFEVSQRVAKECRDFLLRLNDSGDTWQEILTRVVTDLLIYDAGIIEIVKDDRGEPKELCPYLGSEFFPVEDDSGILVGYDQVNENLNVVEGIEANEEAVPFLKEDIVYFRLFPNNRTLLGTPLLETIIDECVTVILAHEHAMLALDADEIPPGLLVLGGLAGPAADRARADLSQMKGKDHKIRVLTSSQPNAIEAKWVELRKTPKDLQMLDVVDDIRRTIWRVFGVQPVELGVTENVPKASAVTQMDVSSSHLITPILELLSAKINARIIQQIAGENAGLVRFQWDRSDKHKPDQLLDQSRMFGEYLKRGVMTVNEVRRDLGLLPVSGGDTPIVETNMGPMPLQALAEGVIPQILNDTGYETDGDALPSEDGSYEDAEEVLEDDEGVAEAYLYASRGPDYGSKKNAAKSMASLPESKQKALKKKGEEHNEKYGDDPKRRLPSINYLAVSFHRGVGAYNTNPSSVRPNVTSADQWAYARVNGLLYAMRNLKFKRKPFDTDLLAKDHPNYLQDDKSAASRDEENTDFPAKGDNKEVSLKNSQWGVFDPAYAKMLKEKHPKIWQAGGNIRGNSQYRKLYPIATRPSRKPNDKVEEDAVRLREAWVARHFEDGRQHKGDLSPNLSNIAGIIAQIKWLAVGTLGEAKMKSVVNEVIKKMEKSACMTPSTNLDAFGKEVNSINDLRSLDFGLPSQWQSEDYFRDMRTLDIPMLANSIIAYSQLIHEHYVDATISTLAFMNSKAVSESPNVRAELVNGVNRILDDLYEKWSIATYRYYNDAARTGYRSSKKYVDPDYDWRSEANAFHLLAMNYLIDGSGLIGTLKGRCMKIIADKVEPTIGRSSHDEPSIRAKVKDAIFETQHVFTSQAYRIMNWSGKLVELANKAFDSSMGSSSEKWYVIWHAIGDNRTCQVCADQDAQPIRERGALPILPGGGTPCGARCRCVLEYYTQEEYNMITR